jgi:hypothetical protein
MPSNASQFAHLRPSTPLEMLDRTWAVLCLRPWLFLGLGVLCALPELAANILLAVSPVSENATQAGAGLLPLLVIAWVLEQWPVAATVLCAFQLLALPNRPLRLWVAMQGALARLFPFVVTRFFAWAIILGLMFLLVQGAAGGNPVWVVLGMPALGLSLILMVLWSLISPVVIIERRSLSRAMQRSAELMRARYGRGGFADSAVCRLLLLLILPVSVHAAEGLLVHGAGFFLPGGVMPFMPASRGYIFYYSAVSFAGKVIREPWMFVGLVLLYSESRMRFEALDLQIRLLGGAEPLVEPAPEPARDE